MEMNIWKTGSLKFFPSGFVVERTFPTIILDMDLKVSTGYMGRIE